MSSAVGGHHVCFCFVGAEVRHEGQNTWDEIELNWASCLSYKLAWREAYIYIKPWLLSWISLIEPLVSEHLAYIPMPKQVRRHIPADIPPQMEELRSNSFICIQEIHPWFPCFWVLLLNLIVGSLGPVSSGLTYFDISLTLSRRKQCYFRTIQLLPWWRWWDLSLRLSFSVQIYGRSVGLLGSPYLRV